MNEAVFISGATGALGSEIVKNAISTTSHDIVCFTHRTSTARVNELIPAQARSRVRFVQCDLSDPNSIVSATQHLSRYENLTGIHCAADISWSKSHRLIDPLNIQGTQDFAELISRLSVQKPKFIFVSTAYVEDGAFRNAYEASKSSAEQILKTRFQEKLRLGIVRPSLIVGSSANGRITRFNGLYPLLRVIALAEVPCVIAEPSYNVDMVPVDFVSDAVFETIELLGHKNLVTARVISSDKAINVCDLIEVIRERANNFRRAVGAWEVPKISVINERQFRFLMDAAGSWNLTARFDLVDRISRIMAGYISHGKSDFQLSQSNYSKMAPFPQEYLPRVTDFWLHENESRIKQAPIPSWMIDSKEHLNYAV